MGRPARTYIQQLCEDTGCNPEDLPEAMNDREKWRESVRDIRARGATWWWWWWCLMKFVLTKKCCQNIHIYIYICVYVCVCVRTRVCAHVYTCICQCVCLWMRKKKKIKERKRKHLESRCESLTTGPSSSSIVSKIRKPSASDNCWIKWHKMGWIIERTIEETQTQQEGKWRAANLENVIRMIPRW